jgi:2-C-methyl-D-erythritol 4-phosphate cytidylyltransferase
VPGGASRAASVRAGLEEVAEDAAVTLVHDAARPVLPAEVIERLMTALNEGWDGVVPGLPVADTVKRIDGEQVVETIDRESLVGVQTPQAFVSSALRDAAVGGDQATDCAALVEARGGRIKVVPGDRRLLKITEPVDLETVASWLTPAD